MPNEGMVTFDVRFYVLVPGGERIKILLNIEIQKDYYPGYDVVTRAVFTVQECCRHNWIRNLLQRIMMK